MEVKLPVTVSEKQKTTECEHCYKSFSGGKYLQQHRALSKLCSCNIFASNSRKPEDVEAVLKTLSLGIQVPTQSLANASLSKLSLESTKRKKERNTHEGLDSDDSRPKVSRRDVLKKKAPSKKKKQQSNRRRSYTVNFKRKVLAALKNLDERCYKRLETISKRFGILKDWFLSGKRMKM